MNKTNFYICRNDTIAEIQRSFSRFYPTLAINFFSNNEKNQSNASCIMFSPEVRVREISLDCQDGCIELNNNMTTGDLEKSIHDHFGLHVEISPRTGNQTATPLRKMTQSSMINNPEAVRLPERSDAVYFKNVPFGC
jgi:hypothetical protein